MFLSMIYLQTCRVCCKFLARHITRTLRFCDILLWYFNRAPRLYCIELRDSAVYNYLYTRRMIYNYEDV